MLSGFSSDTFVVVFPIPRFGHVPRQKQPYIKNTKAMDKPGNAPFGEPYL